MFPHSIISVLLVLFVSGSELCDRHEAVQGCVVDNGHAQCEAQDLAASIHGLPTCTTRITFSLLADHQYINIQKYRRIYLWHIDFRLFTGLQELSISTNYGNYSHIMLYMYSSVVVNMMPNIKVLRLKALSFWQPLTAKIEGIYKRVKHLEVLDFTRAQRMGLSAASHVIGKEPSMKTLILRNIQEISHVDTYNPFVDDSLCVRGKCYEPRFKL